MLKGRQKIAQLTERGEKKAKKDESKRRDMKS